MQGRYKKDQNSGVRGALRVLLFLLSSMAGICTASAQEEVNDTSSVWEKLTEPKTLKLDNKKIEITQSLQLWNVYTFGTPDNQENRNDLYIRRGRIGVKGALQQNLIFNVTFAYDGIGRDEQTAGKGSPNPADNHDFFLWEAYTQWKYKPLLNITAGYFRPQVGREHMTAAFKTTSFEKSLSNFQPRAHAIARSTGRELGINIGGLYLANGWSLNYNLGLFDMSAEELIGEGASSLPMLASRVAFTLGDPEMKKYGIGYTQSYYGKRKGITLAINSTYQGQTKVFKSNSFYGADVLANWGPWDFMAEYDRLYRNSLLEPEIADVADKNAVETIDEVITFKAAYNLLLSNGKVLQAAAMYATQQANGFGDTAGINSLTGATDHQVYDIGINYLINQDNLKLNLHWVWGRFGDNNPAQKYAYLGTGFQYLF